MKPTIEWLLAEYSRLGYTPFKGKPGRALDVNIIGVRTIPGTPNKFDDWICLLWFDHQIDKWQLEAFHATTDPGTYWLENPGRVNGTAILVPGRYPKCWKLGMHKGEYPALVQAAPGVFKNWRDGDKDGLAEYTGVVYTDVAGLNLHHAGQASTNVDKWSAACQVIASLVEWGNFWTLIKASAAEWGDTFSYVLLTHQS